MSKKSFLLLIFLSSNLLFFSSCKKDDPDDVEATPPRDLAEQYISENEINKYDYFPNVIVNEIPEFNNVGREVYQTLEKTAKYVLRALALYLEIDENYFDKYIENGNSILRPIHYPPLSEDPKEAVRAAIKCNKPSVIDVDVDPKALYSFRRDSFKHREKKWS